MSKDTCDYCDRPVYDIEVLGTSPHTYVSKVCSHHYYKNKEMEAES